MKAKKKKATPVAKKKKASVAAKKKKIRKPTKKEADAILNLFSSGEDFRRFSLALLNNQEIKKEFDKLVKEIMAMRKRFDRLEHYFETVDINPAISDERREEIRVKLEPILDLMEASQDVAFKHGHAIDEGNEALLAAFNILAKRSKPDNAMAIAATLEESSRTLKLMIPQMQKLNEQIIRRIVVAEKEMNRDIN